MAFGFRSVFLAAVAAGSAAFAEEDVMVVFDGSNSMWGQIEGTAKIEIARGVMDNLLGDWTEDRNVGLMAYGHRRRGDCGDIRWPAESRSAPFLVSTIYDGRLQQKDADHDEWPIDCFRRDMAHRAVKRRRTVKRRGWRT